MVDRTDLTTPEIAAAYGRSLHTVQKSWTHHPSWPPAIGERGRYRTYAAADVERFVREHIDRETVTWEPTRLYTAREIADAAGITAATIRADASRGRWPAPDNTEGRAHRWTGATVKAALANRRGYRRTTD